MSNSDTTHTPDLYEMILKLEERCKWLETEIVAVKADAQLSHRALAPEVPEIYFGRLTTPLFRFGELSEHISVSDEDVTTLIDSPVKTMLSELLTRNLHDLSREGNPPIHVFRNKLHVYDINSDNDITSEYETNTTNIDTGDHKGETPLLLWQPCAHKESELIYLLNSIQKTIISKLIAWKAKQDTIRISADVCDLIYQKTLQKILKIDFKSRTVIMAVRAMLSKICENL
jgi:hypothetical protein